jgi:cell division septum initiation protein DivIVA
MSDFERSGDRSGVTYDEPIKRRSPGTFFADIGDKLARGFNSFDRPQPDEPDWDRYEEVDQPTAAVDTLPPEEPSRRRFPASLHGYDRDAVEDYIDGLEHEIGQMAAKLSAQRSPTSAVQAEIDRVGEETSAILRVAHEQAAEITRRARVEADRCVSDAAANAVSMTEDAKRKLRQLDSETDAVWAERMRLIEDVRNVATSLFSLAEDATDRFPEDGDKDSATVAASAVQPASKPAPPAQQAQAAQAAPPAQPKAASAPQQRSEPGAPAPATPAASAQHRQATPSPVAASAPMPAPSPVAAQNHAPRPERPRS